MTPHPPRKVEGPSRVSPGISLGPILYYWPRDTVFAFYEQAAAWPVETIYLGETVCSKRHEMRPVDWMDIARKLCASGKEVVLSSCELLESEQDLRVLRKLAGNGEYRVEANDIGAVRLLAGRMPFVAGPYLNIYSRPTLDVYRAFGATRWVAPLELSGAGLGEVLGEEGPGIETEVFAFGRLPLAISARCFTARYNNLSKDDCGFRCIEHPDGLVVSTQEDEAFLALNGLQTQSARVQELSRELPMMRALGVARLRISPQSSNTAEIVATYRALCDGRAEAAAAASALRQWACGEPCDGYWHAAAGLQRVRKPLDAGAHA